MIEKYRLDLIIEHGELSRKIHKLEKFLAADNSFTSISDASRNLLILQLGIMENYATVLKLRLELEE